MIDLFLKFLGDVSYGEYGCGLAKRDGRSLALFLTFAGEKESRTEWSPSTVDREGIKCIIHIVSNGLERRRCSQPGTNKHTSAEHKKAPAHDNL